LFQTSVGVALLGLFLPLPVLLLLGLLLLRERAWWFLFISIHDDPADNVTSFVALLKLDVCV
jgi:hypothetical protein